MWHYFFVLDIICVLDKVTEVVFFQTEVFDLCLEGEFHVAQFCFALLSSPLATTCTRNT